MKFELSREDCVKLKLFDTDKDAPVAEPEPKAGEKNPEIEPGSLASKLRFKFAPFDTLPEPITDGISRKLTGIDLADRTTFNKILSLLYCSRTSRYADDIAPKLVEPVIPAQPDKNVVQNKVEIRILLTDMCMFFLWCRFYYDPSI